jgi:hypothetical protein
MDAEESPRPRRQPKPIPTRAPSPAPWAPSAGRSAKLAPIAACVICFGGLASLVLAPKAPRAVEPPPAAAPETKVEHGIAFPWSMTNISIDGSPGALRLDGDGFRLELDGKDLGVFKLGPFEPGRPELKRWSRPVLDADQTRPHALVLSYTMRPVAGNARSYHDIHRYRWSPQQRFWAPDGPISSVPVP